MKKVSAIVLTQDNEKYLPGCLKSLTWVDEIIVVDAGSSDSTLEIAKNAKAKIVKSKWKGFPHQRNIGAENASGKWLLYIDSDERVSKELREEIQNLIKKNNTTHSSFKIPHRNYILGKWLKRGGWYPEYQHRLIKKDKLGGWKGELHEHPEVKGSTGKLNQDLIHLTHRGMEWMLKKTIRYTKLEAQLRRKANHPKVKVVHLFSAPFREFWFRCVKKAGWKDGMEGWIEILYQSFNHFLIMVWLWEMQKDQTMKQKYLNLDRKISDEL